MANWPSQRPSFQNKIKSSSFQITTSTTCGSDTSASRDAGKDRKSSTFRHMSLHTLRLSDREAILIERFRTC